MNLTHRSIAAAAALLAATALPAAAGLRQWEPSDYVQDGLVLHFDGIRNAGLNVAHNSAATTWVDLSGNGRDATLTPGAGSAWTNGVGFYFNKNAVFATSATFAMGTKFTYEVLVDAARSDWTSADVYVIAPGADMNNGTIYYKKNNSILCLRSNNLNGSTWESMAGYSSLNAMTYLTALRDDTRTALVTGTDYPTTSWDLGTQGAIGTTDGRNYVTEGGWLIGTKNEVIGAKTWLFGAMNATAGNSMKGTMKSVRIYNALLTEAQLAWNRAVDEARFFGASAVTAAPVPGAIPDAFITNSVAGAEGFEATGAYVVDDDGYTFTAPAARTISGTTYALAGCTVATWDDATGAYGAAETRNGVFAVAVAVGDKVKITWQWAAASGSLGGDMAGYVSDGILMHFDGIRNAGADRPHDMKTTTWANLSGASSDAILRAKTQTGHIPGYGEGDFVGEWQNNGFLFCGTNYFYMAGPFAIPSNYTMQVVMDADVSSQVNNIPYVLIGKTGGEGAIYLNKGLSAIQQNTDSALGTAYASRPKLVGSTWRYVTAILDNGRAAIFAGNALPSDDNTDSANGGWFVQTDASKVSGASYSQTRITFGGGHDTVGSYLVGTVKAIRLYNRVLDSDELARNRALDEARFFGNGAPASNAVVVATSIAGLEGREPSGVYFPDAWTFAAGANQTVRGLEWQCAGYQLQTWDADSGAWGTQQTVLPGGGNAVEYASPSAPFASVRLTWLWKPVSGIRTAADYALADYAAGALEIQLDGIAHGSSATVWSDLSGHGRDATLAGNGDGTSAWAADGYNFNGNAVFATSEKFRVGRHSTVEMLVDTAFADYASGKNGQIFSCRADNAMDGWVYLHKNGGAFRYRSNNVTGIAWTSEPGVWYRASSMVRASYLTALRDGARAALITGTAHPTTTGTVEKGANNGNDVVTDWSVGTKNDAPTADIWRFGANNATGTGNAFKGSIKSIRAYDRLLAEDELAWNRSVDSARYFGALATTNVLVVANEFSGLADDTAYEVFGPHTFGSVASAIDGSSANFVRVQTLQPNGTWMETTRIEGGSYDYTPAAGTVRIEFRKSNPFVMVVR